MTLENKIKSLPKYTAKPVSCHAAKIALANDGKLVKLEDVLRLIKEHKDGL